MKPVPFSLAAAALLASLLVSSPLRADPVKPPIPAPVWTMPDPDGKQIHSTDFKGKVLVVNFWATWCPPCKEEMPGFQALQNKYAQDVVFVGMSVDGDPARPRVKKFLKDTGITYQVVMSDDDILTKSGFNVNQGYPTTFIIGRDGKIHVRKVGKESMADFEKELVSVLAAPGV